MFFSVSPCLCGEQVSGSHTRQAHAAEHPAQAGFQRLIHFAGSLVHSGNHQVLQHFDVARLHNFRLNDDLEQLLLARSS